MALAYPPFSSGSAEDRILLTPQHISSHCRGRHVCHVDSAAPPWPHVVFSAQQRLPMPPSNPANAMTEAALPAVQAALATLRNGWETGLANPRAIGLVFKPITLSYSGAFNYHTLHPIEYIQASQDYGAEPETTVRALARFRQTKDEELAFVRPAVSAHRHWLRRVPTEHAVLPRPRSAEAPSSVSSRGPRPRRPYG